MKWLKWVKALLPAIVGLFGRKAEEPVATPDPNVTRTKTMAATVRSLLIDATVTDGQRKGVIVDVYFGWDGDRIAAAVRWGGGNRKDILPIDGLTLTITPKAPPGGEGGSFSGQ